MTAIDYLFAGILLLSSVAGVWRGFLKEVCALVTWILAFWASWRFGALVEPHLGGVLVDPPFSTWAARGIVFIAVLVLGSVIGAVLSHLVRLSLLGALDRALGLLFGALRGTVILGLLVVLGQAARLDGETWWQKSRLMPYFSPIAKVLHAVGGDRLHGLSAD
jgi:membrane protein required for colicin V production